MRSWRVLPDERTALFSPIGLLPLDDVTGRPPLGKLTARLDIRDVAGDWHETEVRPVRTLGGVIAYPALGRRRNPVGLGPTRYRVRVEASHYIPSYRSAHDGIEFDAFPYDDANPPQAAPAVPEPLVLMPAPAYPFPSHLLVLRGVVSDAAGTPVRDAAVEIGSTRRTLTDARGCFALALPWPLAAGPLILDASDARTGRVGSCTVQFSQAAVPSISITIV